MICPCCDGNGYLLGFVDPPPGPVPPEIKCDLCGGVGTLDEATKQRRKDGRTLRRLRIAHDQSLRQTADALGLRPAEVSEMERGIRDFDLAAILTKLRWSEEVQRDPFLLCECRHIAAQHKEGKHYCAVCPCVCFVPWQD